ncbi:MAG: universal stress protein, partial [Pseudomonadota bacterium]
DAVREISADLLVIGSANRTGLQGLIIGNTAEGVIDRTDCGIYVVKPEGFASVIGSTARK